MTENEDRIEESTDLVVNEETATNEFERWATAMRLKLDRLGTDENERRDNEADRQNIIQDIKAGRAYVNDAHLMVYKPENGKEITFYRPRGADLVVMDKKKKSADMGKVITSLASVTRTSEPTFSNMYQSDLDSCLAIWSLFLA